MQPSLRRSHSAELDGRFMMAPAIRYVYSDTNEPCNFTLIVEDGVEFKVHKSVLSRASPFFEKLLNGSMKEAEEGVVRLKLFTVPVMRAILEFIYTGNVQTVSTDHAQELIAMADYLLIPQLKSLAEKVLIQNLAQTLTASNCLSMISFGERHQCKNLVSNTTKFVLANFSEVAGTENFFRITNAEVEKWISRDEINVRTEEDVFKIILAWIERDKSERKKYFSQLFRHFRLPYVTLDFLNRYVVTNEVVKSDQSCMDLAMELIDSRKYDVLSISPRTSLKTPVIVVSMREDVLCYFPRKDVWCRLHGKVPPSRASFHCGQLRYSLNDRERGQLASGGASHVWGYNARKTSEGENNFRRDSEIYALLSLAERSRPECVSLQPTDMYAPSNEKLNIELDLFAAMKHKPTSNLDDISFEIGVKAGICVVSSGDFIAFLGDDGKSFRWYHSPMINLTGDHADSCGESRRSSSDLNKHNTEKARRHGEDDSIAACRRLIIGGRSALDRYSYFDGTREVRNKTTDECQFVANLKKKWRFHGFVTLSGDKLYAVGVSKGSKPMLTIECFDPGRGEWHAKTGVPVSSTLHSEEQQPTKDDQQKCVMM